jgi:hypothetical protein
VFSGPYACRETKWLMATDNSAVRKAYAATGDYRIGKHHPPCRRFRPIDLGFTDLGFWGNVISRVVAVLLNPPMRTEVFEILNQVPDMCRSPARSL